MEQDTIVVLILMGHYPMVLAKYRIFSHLGGTTIKIKKSQVAKSATWDFFMGYWNQLDMRGKTTPYF